MSRRIGFVCAALIIYMGLPAAGHALQVLEAADHAELEAEISATALNRVALENDRIARVMQAPGGLVVEHDPVRGDIYVRAISPAGAGAGGSDSGQVPVRGPLTLYLGTERGLTYRLSLRAVERDSAQILIRNAGAVPMGFHADGVAGADAYASDLVELIRAAASNAPPPGYLVVSGSGAAHGSPAHVGPVDGRLPDGSPAARNASAGGLSMPVALIETWSGHRYRVRVLRVPAAADLDAQALAADSGTGVLAAWVSGETVTIGGARRGAVVELNDGAGVDR